MIYQHKSKYNCFLGKVMGGCNADMGHCTGKQCPPSLDFWWRMERARKRGFKERGCDSFPWQKSILPVSVHQNFTNVIWSVLPEVCAQGLKSNKVLESGNNFHKQGVKQHQNLYAGSWQISPCWVVDGLGNKGSSLIWSHLFNVLTWMDIFPAAKCWQKRPSIFQGSLHRQQIISNKL